MSPLPRLRPLIALSTLTLAFASCWPFDVGGDCATSCTAGQVACPQLDANATALGAYHDAEGEAARILGASPAPRWMGAFAGLEITRAGTPKQDPDTLTVLGTTQKVYLAGWVFKFCSGRNAVVFGAGPATSSAEQSCQDVNCEAVAPSALPAVDSAAAIAAAFPGDPAGTLYAVSFTPVTHNGKRLWDVTRNPSGPTVLVDADTGAVVQP